jgi:arsenite-transporting ATPase
MSGSPASKPTLPKNSHAIRPPQFVFFGGKGGVGKTTCAAAFAVGSAAAGNRVLLVSTDPAHSLVDILGTPLSGRVKRVRGPAGNLAALELDAPRAFRRWLRRHRRPLGDILEHGTWLDRADVDALLDLALPGVDELMGLRELLDVVQTVRSAYDVVVVDTAPTGHTLRLFGAPQTMHAVSTMLDALQHEHRLIREQFARAAAPEAADLLIEALADQAVRTADLLRDRGTTTIKWVMLPERLSAEETADALRDLTAAGIVASELIVNRLTPDGPSCAICDRQRAAQKTVVATLDRLTRNVPVRLLSEAEREPKGVSALLAFSRRFSKGASSRRTPAGNRSRLRPPRGIAFSGPASEHSTALASLSSLADARLVFFVGKGGVGKTTVATAAALHLARTHPELRVLVISTDPAHSLGDALEASLGDRTTQVPGFGNLYARELNAREALDAHRASLEEAVHEIVTTIGSSTGLAGSNGAAELVRLTPPGVDELLGLLSLIEVRAAGDVHAPDLVMVDTAPTGHMLRLLEMPATARQWLHTLLKMLLKYRELVRPGRLAEELLVLSRSVGALDRMLHKAAQTRFVLVTRASELPKLESERLIRHLRTSHFATPLVILNAMTLAAGTCPLCRARARGERRPAAAFRQTCRRHARGCAIIQTALAAPPPVGADALTKWVHTWTRADEAGN